MFKKCQEALVTTVRMAFGEIFQILLLCCSVLLQLKRLPKQHLAFDVGLCLIQYAVFTG